MEQIIPILVAAVVFGFQAYANYKKEQEKAKQRQQANRQKPSDFGSDEVSYEDEPFIEQPFPDFIPTPVPAENIPAEPIQTTKPDLTPNPYEKYEGMIDRDKDIRRFAERRPARTLRQAANVNLDKKLEITDVVEDGIAEIEPAASVLSESKGGLDLRQAVIHSIILERPYH